MILVISPAKKLDYSAETRYTETFSQPLHLDASQELIDVLAKKETPELESLMSISSALANLNAERYQEFSTPFTPANAKQALLAFDGDVYGSFERASYGEDEFSYAQEHLRILSGLYGLLRPLDLMQPYRLEMGTRLSTQKGKNLYEFWGDRITHSLNEVLEEKGFDTLVNLASNEYFKSVNKKGLKAQIITPSFKDIREGKAKTIFLYAKQARGLMCDFAIKEKIASPEGLKDFAGMGYQFNAELSSDKDWVFTRES